jgi:hypothetical protein
MKELLNSHRQVIGQSLLVFHFRQYEVEFRSTIVAHKYVLDVWLHIVACVDVFLHYWTSLVVVSKQS